MLLLAGLAYLIGLFLAWALVRGGQGPHVPRKEGVRKMTRHIPQTAQEVAVYLLHLDGYETVIVENDRVCLVLRGTSSMRNRFAEVFNDGRVVYPKARL